MEPNVKRGREAEPDMRWTGIDSPIGPLTLCATDEGLCRIDFGGWETRGEGLSDWAARRRGHRLRQSPDDKDPVLREAKRQLSDYFLGNLTRFRLPLALAGTPFQLRVWEALTQVPYGATASYKDIAEAIGQPKAVRAVGGANNRNVLPIIVPCHRIVGAGGGLVGYAGGLPAKEKLLELERAADASRR